MSTEALTLSIPDSLARELDSVGEGLLVDLLERGLRQFKIEQALDRDRAVLAEQAYKIELSAASIDITANAPPGLFYGVQTSCNSSNPRMGSPGFPRERSSTGRTYNCAKSIGMTPTILTAWRN